MGQQAVDTGALLQAIQAEPGKLGELLTQNPTVASLLATAYPDLQGAPNSTLAAASNALPEVPFEQLFELTNGTLTARPGPHSTFEFQLTLKNVQPGQTQEKLEALVAEINARLLSMKSYPSCGYQVYLAYNDDLPNYEEAGDVVFTCSSLIHDSTDRHRDQTITRDGQRRISQEALLSQHGLVEQPNDVVRAIAGMFRLAEGFPDKEEDICTERDQGDVFKGKIARTKQGSSSGSVASYPTGVSGRSCSDAFPYAHVGVVGGLSTQLKKATSVGIQRWASYRGALAAASPEGAA
jgi:hypothetical protein